MDCECVLWAIDYVFGAQSSCVDDEIFVCFVYFHTCTLHTWQVINRGLTIDEALQATENPCFKTHSYHQVNVAWNTIAEAVKK